MIIKKRNINVKELYVSGYRISEMINDIGRMNNGQNNHAWM